jgi:hypothetical protein
MCSSGPCERRFNLGRKCRLNKCSRELFTATSCYPVLVTGVACYPVLVTGVACYPTLVSGVACYPLLVTGVACYPCLLPALLGYALLVVRMASFKQATSLQPIGLFGCVSSRTAARPVQFGVSSKRWYSRRV